MKIVTKEGFPCYSYNGVPRFPQVTKSIVLGRSSDLSQIFCAFPTLMGSVSGFLQKTVENHSSGNCCRILTNVRHGIPF